MALNLNPAKWTGDWGRLWLLLLMPLFVLIAILSLPLVLLFWLIDYTHLRYHCWKSGRWTYLVAHKRRGWHEFIGNNVAPVVPADVTLVWADKLMTRGNPLYLLCMATGGQAKPCLVRVNWFRLRVRSIHSRLANSKSQRRVDHALRERLGEILREECAVLHGQALRKSPG